MKIDNKDITINSLKQTFLEGIVSGSKIKLPLLRMMNRLERLDLAKSLMDRLQKKGYSEFSVHFDHEGNVEIVDGKELELGLAEWEVTERGQAKEAASRIRAAFYKNSTHLDLSNFGLASLPKELWTLTDLDELSLSHNLLHRLPPEIGLLSKLTKLSLNGNKLLGLPSEIGNLKNLIELNLEFNFLRNPPQSLNFAQWLEIYLLDHQFEGLPSELWTLENLKALYLGHNLLQSIPPEIRGLERLQFLSLRCNKLQELPSEFWDLECLIGLNLSKIQLKNLSSSIGRLLKLENLDVSGNEDLSELPLALGDCQRLTYLDTEGTLIAKNHCDRILQLARAQSRQK